MLIIGLTGSVGMGKSTVAGHLRTLGIPVCDADAIVHELYEDEAVAPIEAAFPGTTVAGKVDRAKLSAALLADPPGFARLEAIVHPLVKAAERACLSAAFRSGATIAVLEIPLLMETGGAARCDATLVVSAPADVQRRRVLARPGMTDAKLAAILARQMPDAEKRGRADFVVDTGVSIEQTLAQVDTVISALRTRAGNAYARHWA